MTHPGKAIERGARIATLLTKHPEGLAKEQIVRKLGGSSPTVQRAIDAINRENPSLIEYDRSSKTWRITDPSYGDPLLYPQVSDLNAILMARALLGPLADIEVLQRLDLLLEKLDERRAANEPGGSRANRRAVSASITLGTPVPEKLLKTFLIAVNRTPLRIRFRSTWADREHLATFEPWEVRIHDGAIYARGYWRERHGPYTLRLAQVEDARPLDSRFEHRIPRPSQRWGEGDPAYGIDEDQPGVATLEFVGGVARWVASIRWHPSQEDEWLEPRQRLMRTVPYKSQREFARRLLSVADGLVRVEPFELAEKLHEYVGAFARQVPPRSARASTPAAFTR